jgi:hypothetical protein
MRIRVTDSQLLRPLHSSASAGPADAEWYNYSREYYMWFTGINYYKLNYRSGIGVTINTGLPVIETRFSTNQHSRINNVIYYKFSSCMHAIISSERLFQYMRAAISCSH